MQQQQLCTQDRKICKAKLKQEVAKACLRKTRKTLKNLERPGQASRGSAAEGMNTDGLRGSWWAQSAVNIGGGFTITQRMLDMFKRPGDPEEHNEYLALPAAATIAAYAAGTYAGAPPALPRPALQRAWVSSSGRGGHVN